MQHVRCTEDKLKIPLPRLTSAVLVLMLSAASARCMRMQQRRAPCESVRCGCVFRAVRMMVVPAETLLVASCLATEWSWKEGAVRCWDGQLVKELTRWRMAVRVEGFDWPQYSMRHPRCRAIRNSGRSGFTATGSPTMCSNSRSVTESV